MNDPIAIQPPPLSVTIRLDGEVFMVTSEFTDSMRISATKVQREMALSLLWAAVEVLERGDAA